MSRWWTRQEECRKILCWIEKQLAHVDALLLQDPTKQQIATLRSELHGHVGEAKALTRSANTERGPQTHLQDKQTAIKAAFQAANIQIKK